MAIQRYKSVGTDQIPSESIFHILVWYLKTRLIQYFCTQSANLAHVQQCESAILFCLWLFYCCSVSLAWCFVSKYIKKKLFGATFQQDCLKNLILWNKEWVLEGLEHLTVKTRKIAPKCKR